MSQNESLNNLLSFLKDKNTITHEFLRTLEVNVTSSSDKLPDCDMLRSALYACTDKMIVTFKNADSCEDDIVIISNKDSNAMQTYASFRDICSHQDKISVTLRIEKDKKKDTISIYCFDQFCKDLVNQSIPEMLESFSDEYKQENQICFHVLDQNVTFLTETMAFTSDPQAIQWGILNRKQRLLQCQGVSNFEPRNQYPFIPEDFRIQSGNAPADLKERFEQICSILSMAYLAESSIIEQQSVTLWFDLKKIVSCAYEMDSFPVNSEFYEIYHQVYAEGNAADKAPLARTAIRTYLPKTGLEKLDSRVLEMFQQHYQLYLRENVEKYIELTNAMAGFIKDSIQGITECISQLFGNLKTNLIAVLSFIFTVALANAVSDQPLDNFFTHDIKWIL